MNPHARDRFTALLRGHECGPGVFNPYRTTAPDDAVARPAQSRLRRLAHHLAVAEPRLLLIGEAAGYQGCRCSGIAFTSERLLLEGQVPRVARPRTRLSRRPRPWSEPSATVVWGALWDLKLARHAVLFNAFPFHPHEPDEPLSNRAPTAAELAEARPLLRAFLDLYPDVQPVAVGVTAQHALAALDRDVPALRHPAFGGATAFRSGLARLARSLRARARSAQLSLL